MIRIAIYAVFIVAIFSCRSKYEQQHFTEFKSEYIQLLDSIFELKFVSANKNQEVFNFQNRLSRTYPYTESEISLSTIPSGKLTVEKELVLLYAEPSSDNICFDSDTLKPIFIADFKTDKCGSVRKDEDSRRWINLVDIDINKDEIIHHYQRNNCVSKQGYVISNKRGFLCYYSAFGTGGIIYYFGALDTMNTVDFGSEVYLIITSKGFFDYRGNGIPMEKLEEGVSVL